MRTHREDELSIEEQAAQWLCDLLDEDFNRRAQFAAWLRESPRHVEEFLLTSAAWKEMDQAGPRRSEDVESAIAEARRLAADDNVVALHPRDESLYEAPAPTRRGRGFHIQAAAAVFGLAISALLSWWLIAGFASDSYETGIGEQRSIRLADGSLVHLNTRSRLSVEFTEDNREVKLIEGEAFFTVARDPNRPFRVDAGSSLIQAIGTQFNVYRRPRDVTVSVLEGIVQVGAAAPTPSVATSAAGSATAPRLSAGEEAKISSDGAVLRRKVAEIDDAVAWRERRLVFRSERLEDIAAEFRRYSSRHIRIEGQLALDKRLTASFASDDPESLVLFLEQLDDLSVQREGQDFVVRER